MPFFNQDMVIDLGFVNAAFITDQHHLIDSGLAQKFGKAGSDLLKGHLLGMIRAPTEVDFKKNYNQRKFFWSHCHQGMVN